MPTSREPDEVHQEGYENACCPSNNDAEKERAESSIHLDAAYSHHNGLKHPYDEDCGNFMQKTCGGDYEANRMNWPPRQPVTQRGEECHKQSPESEEQETFPGCRLW